MPTPVGLRLLRTQICSSSMISLQWWNLHCERWVLTIPDCQCDATQTPADEEAAEKAHADRTRALMSGEAPPRLTSNQPPVQSQQPSGTTANDQAVSLETGRVYKTNPTPHRLEYRRAIPVSRQAARDALLAMEYDPQGFSMGDWYVWYIRLERVTPCSISIILEPFRLTLISKKRMEAGRATSTMLAAQGAFQGNRASRS